MENSSASGIYYCVASNKIGEEERSIEFYVSGKQHRDTAPKPGAAAVTASKAAHSW